MTTKKNDNTELATIDNNTELAPAVSMEEIMSGNGLVNTVDMSSMEGMVNVANALNSAMSLKDAKDSVLDVCDIIIMPGVRKGRGNMPDTPCKNTYLIDTSGNAWFSQSEGIARSATNIAGIFRQFMKSNDDGCLHMHVHEQPLPNGNTIKNLVLDN